MYGRVTSGGAVCLVVAFAVANLYMQYVTMGLGNMDMSTGEAIWRKERYVAAVKAT